MLSYQHAYHAGNFADVVKHALLAIILERLGQKPKSFTYYDTHAGRGVYSVDSPEMLKKPEYKDGLTKVWAAREQAPDELKPYLDVVARLNPDGELKVVPGSPLLAQYLCRENDTLELCELHPGELDFLRRKLGGDRRVHIHKLDGHAHIPALLPPATSRGVVIIDPSYELKDDYTRVVDTVAAIFKRWPQACVLVWYPLLPDRRHLPLVDGLAGLEIPATWQAEVALPPTPTGMYGTGQIVLGLPWQLDEPLHAAADWLANILDAATGHADCRLLVEPA